MAPADPSHYDVLGVDRRASAVEVRKAYLRLAREHHPDFHTNDLASTRAANEREMQRINQAWEVLGDAELRRAYDERWGSEQGVEQRRRPGAASYDFRPVDDGPDVDYAALLDDTPVVGTSVSRVAQVVPAVLFLVGSALFVVGAIVQLAALVAFGIIVAVVGLLGFVVTPAMAIARSLQAERDP
ncbi:MAG TPA: J domain-containing protein [Acidimicrobiales bacterium]